MLFFYSESCYSHNSFPLTHNLLQLHVFMLVQTTNAGSSTDRTGAQQCVSKIPAQTHLKTGHSTAIHTNTQMVWCNQCSDPPRPDRDASKLPSGDLLTLSNLKSLPLSSVSHHISSSSLTFNWYPTWRVSSPHNENYVIKYSHSCLSKPSFIFGTQIKIFLLKLESYLTLHRQQSNWIL